jgi:hypothetical protein
VMRQRLSQVTSFSDGCLTTGADRSLLWRRTFHDPPPHLSDGLRESVLNVDAIPGAHRIISHKFGLASTDSF